MLNSLRSRLWLTYALVIAVVLGIVALALAVYLVRNPIATQQARFRLGAIAAGLPVDRLNLLSTDRLGESLLRIDESFDVRVVLQARDGANLLDTRADLYEPLPLLKVFPILRGFYTVETFTDSAGTQWLYSGRILSSGDKVIVALPQPRSPLKSVIRNGVFANDLLPTLIRAGVLALLLALLLAVLISRWVAAPLQRMATAARAVAEGEMRPIPYEGPSEVQSLAKAFNEMTGKVHASQQSQRDFVANVSHELKTPLTSIQGFAQAMMDGTAKDGQEQEKAAKVIYDEAGRMHRLVVELLDLARLEARTADLQRAPVDLASLLRGVTEKFAPLAKEARVELRTEIGPLPGFIGDGDRLAQVFTNLVDNALKFTPVGGVVTISARQVDAQVEIAVQDTGPGIPEDELERIFERFYQQDRSRQGGQGRGVGLGLSIAREIVRAHRGQLSVSSQFGEGSRFVVLLPVARPDDETASKNRKQPLSQS